MHIVSVLEEVTAPGYSFSIGLSHSFRHPEVLVFGLSPEVAQELINLVADEVSNGREFKKGCESDDLLRGYPVRFTPVSSDYHAQYLGNARWAYEGRPFEVVQLVYPDKQGRWPWDISTRDGFRDNQPVLERASTAGSDSL